MTTKILVLSLFGLSVLASGLGAAEVFRSEFTSQDELDKWTVLLLSKGGRKGEVMTAQPDSRRQPAILFTPEIQSWGFLIKEFKPGRLPAGGKLRLTAYVMGNRPATVVISRKFSWGVAGMEAATKLLTKYGEWERLEVIMDRPKDDPLMSVAIGLDYGNPGGWVAVDKVVVECADSFPATGHEPMPQENVVVTAKQLRKFVTDETFQNIRQAALVWQEALKENPGAVMAKNIAPLFDLAPSASGTDRVSLRDIGDMLVELQNWGYSVQFADEMRNFGEKTLLPPNAKTSLEIDAAGNSREYRTLLLRNNLSCGHNFSITLEGDLAKHARIYRMEYISGQPDYLRELHPGDFVSTGMRQTVGLTFAFSTKDLRPGAYAGEIVVTPFDNSLPIKRMPIHLRVHKTTLPDQLPISAFLFDYSSAQNPEVARFLMDFRVNTFDYSIRKTPEEGTDFAELEKIVANVRQINSKLKFTILVETWFVRDAKGWKPEYNAWLDQLVAEMKKLGLGYNDWIFHIYDETLCDEFLAAAKAIKTHNPNVRIFADWTDKNQEVVRKFLPYIDVWCPKDGDLAFPATHLMKAAKAPVWTYACEPAPMMPFESYRRQAWLAWQYGLSGCSEWTAAVCPFRVAQGDQQYGLLYASSHGIQPSRKLIMWHAGLEDYLLLRLASDQVAASGNTELRRLVTHGVMDIPSHLERAGEWRRRILEAMDK